MRNRLSILFALCLAATSASAHEVWLEAPVWTLAAPGPVQARLRNGEMFSGIELIWDDRQIVRAEMWDAEGMQPITGRLGDLPAIATMTRGDGLVTLLVQSATSTIDYKDFAKFAAFVTEKGADDVPARHAERDLPPSPVREAYSRHVKALVAVGSGAGADAPRGLEVEIVALDNPYTTDPAAPMRFQVLYQGQPMPDHRVALFARAPDGAVTLTHQDTDADGTVTLQLSAGHEYLVDAVVLREPDRALVVSTRGAVWESLWAALTFRVPG